MTNPEKAKVVKEVVKLLDEYPIIGVLNMEELPSSSLQAMRKKLSKTALIMMAKKRLLKIALPKSKKEKISELEKHITKGMSALLFTKENPFELYKIIKKSKTKAAAKPGQTAPNDIVIKEGPTQFTPGPIISEFGSLGIKTSVENGKVTVKEDKIVVKEGEEINEKTASILSTLGIEPMEIGLNLAAVYDKGNVLTKEILDIDEDKFMSDLMTAGSYAFNLAMDIGYLTTETVQPLLAKAYMESMALARSQDILTSETVGEILGKAEAQMEALKGQVKMEEPIKEEKAEEKKEEASEEKPKEGEEKSKEEGEKKEESEEKPETDVSGESETSSQTKKEEVKEEKAGEAPKEDEKKEES